MTVSVEFPGCPTLTACCTANVRLWHKAGISRQARMSAFGAQADIAKLRRSNLTNEYRARLAAMRRI